MAVNFDSVCFKWYLRQCQLYIYIVWVAPYALTIGHIRKKNNFKLFDLVRWPWTVTWFNATLNYDRRYYKMSYLCHVLPWNSLRLACCEGIGGKRDIRFTGPLTVDAGMASWVVRRNTPGIAVYHLIETGIMERKRCFLMYKLDHRLYPSISERWFPLESRICNDPLFRRSRGCRIVASPAPLPAWPAPVLPLSLSSFIYL